MEVLLQTSKFRVFEVDKCFYSFKVRRGEGHLSQVLRVSRTQCLPLCGSRLGPLLPCCAENSPSHASTLLFFFSRSLHAPALSCSAATAVDLYQFASQFSDSLTKISESNSSRVKTSIISSHLRVGDRVIDFCFMQLLTARLKNSSFALCHHPPHSCVCSTSGGIFKL